MDELREMLKLRRDKVEEFRSQGVNPYVNRFKVSSTLGEIVKNYHPSTKEELDEKNKECVVAGRMLSQIVFI